MPKVAILSDMFLFPSKYGVSSRERTSPYMMVLKLVLWSNAFLLTVGSNWTCFESFAFFRMPYQLRDTDVTFAKWEKLENVSK